MAFAPLIPLAASLTPELTVLLETGITSLLSEGGAQGLKRIANLGISALSKEGHSPSQVLEKLGKSAFGTLKDPKKFSKALDKGGKVIDVGTHAASHLAGSLNRLGVLSDSRAGHFQHGVKKFNHGFHRHLGRLGKARKGIFHHLGH